MEAKTGQLHLDLHAGNGDILSWEDAKAHQQQTGVSGLMVARGALIKPWIFKEIKEEKYEARVFLMRQGFNWRALADTGISHRQNASICSRTTASLAWSTGVRTCRAWSEPVAFCSS